MTKRSTNLLERDPDTAGRALLHPRQLAACEVIEDLIARLRKLNLSRDYYSFQKLLFAHLYEVEVEQAEASRNVKRDRQGKGVPPAAAGSWDLELLVLDRLARQLRSVGDALAWRLFNFDRRVCLALSRNHPSGPMFGKAGLNYELGEVETIWKREGVFALLHGVTNCLRIADLTRCEEDGRRLLVEVKRRATGPTVDQMRRIQHAINVIERGAPLRGERGQPSELFVSRQPFKTHLRQLKAALELADIYGVSSLRIGRQWVVNCVSLSGADFDSVEEGIEVSARARDRAYKKAELLKAKHHLQTLRPDTMGRMAGLAPFAVYPFSPNVCARLTCDLLTYSSVMGWDRLAEAFHAKGFRTECPLPDSNEPMTGSSEVLIATRGNMRVVIHGAGVSQILCELVDPDAWVAAVSEVFTMWSAPMTTGSFTFSNAKAVWR